MFERVLDGCESGWTWLVTAGMPPDVGDSRRDEMVSDRWEFKQYRRLEATQPGISRLYRWLSGLTDDVEWRLSYGRSGLARERLHELAAVSLVAIGTFVALPSALFIASRITATDRVDFIAQAYFLFLLLVVMGLCVPALALYNTHRGLAMAALGIAVCSLMITAWWLPFFAFAFIVAPAVSTWWALKQQH